MALRFIDNHTHFNSVRALLLGANLLEVTDEEGRGARKPFSLDRGMVDDLTSDTLIRVNRWDRSAFLANEVALEAAGVDCGRGRGSKASTGRPPASWMRRRRPETEPALRA